MFGSFFKRLKEEKGGILTTLAVTGLIALGVSLFSFGEKAEEFKANKEDITKYGDIQASGDPGKDKEKNNAAFVGIMKEGGKVVVGAYDDTGLLIVLDKSGALDVAEKDENKDDKQDEEIKVKLKDNGLKDDKLNVDFAKALKKKVKVLADDKTTDEELDSLVYEILDEIDQELKDLDAMTEDDFSKIDDIEIIDDITQKLKDQEGLEDKEIIELKHQLNRINNEKDYVQKQIDAFKAYEQKGYILANTAELGNYEDRLDYLEQKVAEINGQIQEMVTEAEEEEETVQEQEAADEEATEDQQEGPTEEGSEDKENQEENTMPTIDLVIVEGPTFSEADQVCYYRVKAKVEGHPEPDISFSRDDSNGAWGQDTVQINLKENNSYTLTATASNSEGSSTDSITLPWGCQEVLKGTVTLRGSGVLTGVIDRNTYPITLNVDLDTGSVTGSSNFSGTARVSVLTGVDEDTGDNIYETVYCPFNATISFSGTLNLSSYSLRITANLVSRYTGTCAGLDNKYLKSTLTGNLNESATYASGTDSEGDSWSVSR